MKLSIVKAVACVVAMAVASPAVAAEVDRRAERQQDRIGQGVQSGTLTAREAARLETREAKIQSEIAQKRAANGGYLTAAQRAKINREQNRASRAIYRQKHDAQVAR